MRLKVRNWILTCFLSSLLVLALVTGAHAYSSVLAFGDSLSDNGTSTYDPYGAAVSTNGAVWVEYLANDMGASLFDMAYSGATTAYDNPAVSSYYEELYVATGDEDYYATSQYFAANTGLQWQVDEFVNNPYYFPNMGSVPDDTLITISAGGNDMFNYRSPITAADNIKTALENLIGAGGDSFMVMNLSVSQQSEAATEWMEAFNSLLAYHIATLQLANKDVEFFLLDMNNFVPDVDELNITWAQYQACTGDDPPEYCDDLDLSGLDDDTTFAWYDTVGVHPTTQVHAQIAEYAANVVAPVPEPATIFLMLSGLAGLVGIRRRKR